MSGFSTIWTAALWQTRQWGEELIPDTPVIGVVNRGAFRATVMVAWFKDDGHPAQEDNFELDPAKSQIRVLFFDNAPNRNGWARIVSDQPVAPWGVTPHIHPNQRQWANIEFYGENVAPPGSIG
jgi:hypothetical protein